MKRHALRLWAGRLSGGLLAMVLAAACAQLVEVDLGAGLGATCTGDDECQGSSCLDGICTVRCGDSNGCPGGTVCSKEICELPMKVGYIYPYPLSQDELAKSFDLGRLGAEAELQFVTSDAIEGRPTGPEAKDAATELVASGHDVIIATSTSQAAGVEAFERENGDVSVLLFSSPNASENLTSFDARMYQAYYMAGFAAARASTTMPPRLGIIGSVAIPSVVARINGFALGAKRALGGVPATIEVKWLGEWHDTQLPGDVTREFLYTRQLLQNGADVIAHTADNNIPLLALGMLAMEDPPLQGRAVAANLLAACEGDGSPEALEAASRCVGSAYYNWTPVFTRAFSDIRRENGGGFLLMGLANGAAESAVGFELGPAAPVGIAGELGTIRGELAVEGVGPIFKGPIVSEECTAQNGGQPPCVAMDQTLSDEGLANMCWFIDDVGLVDRGMGTIDMNAKVPATCRDWLAE